MDRYALTFSVKSGSESAVAGILSGYGSPPAGAAGGSRPLLDRTSVFMAGTTVVRVVDVACAPAEAVRHLAAQPQIRAVEERIRPHLVVDRDLGTAEGRRRFLASSVMRVVLVGARPGGRGRRRATLVQAVPGGGGEVVRLLAAAGGEGVTLCRRRDVVVHVVESDEGLPGALALSGALAGVVRVVCPMELVTDRAAEVVA